MFYVIYIASQAIKHRGTEAECQAFIGKHFAGREHQVKIVDAAEFDSRS